MRVTIISKEELLPDYDKKYPLFLRNDNSVEKEFVKIINWNKDAFWDEESLQLMRDIDSAERRGEYGVITPIGESCITCLSTGTKFGLLVLRNLKYNPDRKLIVNGARAGNNVWDWLIKHTTAHLYILWEDFEEYDYIFFMKYRNLEYCYEGKIYNGSNRTELYSLVDELKEKRYALTKESEAKAYEKYKFFLYDGVFCDVRENIKMEVFMGRFINDEMIASYIEEYGNDLRDYRVINRCNYIQNKFLFRRLALYMCGKKGNSIEIFKNITVKYPTFLEIVIYDVIYGSREMLKNDKKDGEYEELQYCQLYEKMFVLVLDKEERCETMDYPKATLVGIEVNFKEKIITIIDSMQAVEMFHEICTNNL